MKLVKYAFLCCLLISSGACKTRYTEKNASVLKADSSKAVINFQAKKNYTYNNGQVLFSNKFAAARLNAVAQENDSTFNVSIEPENSPINPSPWYAFKVWSATTRNLYIRLNYKTAKHRYNPKINSGNNIWEDVDDVKVSENKKQALFRVVASRDTVLIAGQELITAADTYKWEDDLSMLSFVKKQVIGHSILGKPIVALNITESPGKKMIVVLSRQHPPEVTGYMAMQEFIRTIVANTPLAGNFRKKFEVILIPMVNPDGVDEGNWRHSAAGVDLNRDWEFFVQPETQSIKNYLLERAKKQSAKVYFGIDFHSTFYDVFYTNEDQALKKTNIPGFTNLWLDAFKKAIPDFNPNIKPSPNGGNVSKSWMGKVLNAEALTYEVGDDTPRTMLKMKGRVAAEKMMELLLAAE